jgi:TRAP transporter TAXI family solute receptor
MTCVARLLLLLSLVSFTGFMAPMALLAFDEPMMSIKTGDVTGVYYAVGSAVAKMHNKKRQEYNLRLISETSEGSIANIQDVLAGRAGFGIAQANTLYFARQGAQFWKGQPHDNLRAVLGLHTEDCTLVAAAGSGIETLVDLKGKTVNIGEPGSTDAFQAATVFKHVGLDPQNDLTLLVRPTYEAAELLQEGKIDAYLYTVGHPNMSIIEASSGERKIAIVSLGSEMIDYFYKNRPYLTKTDIPIDYYPDIINKEPIPTISVKAILFTDAEMDAQIVYNIVKEVFENFDLFKRQHPALAYLTVKQMTTGLVVPLHPGAERYFKEAGLLD